MMNTILVDYSFMCYRAGYVISPEDIVSPDGKAMMLTSLLEDIKSLCAKSPVGKTNLFHFFCDSKASYRRDVFPEYKMGRKRNRSEEEEQRRKAILEHSEALKPILVDLGFPLYEQYGLESDDLIAVAAAEQHTGANIIITSDKDLYQCLNSITWFYNPTKDEVVGCFDFTLKYGIEPHEWASVKAIGGCVSDSVPGVRGVGEKTALKYLANTLPTSHKTYKQIQKAATTLNWDTMFEIVTLPHYRTTYFHLSAPCYDADRFFGVCEEHGAFVDKGWWSGFLSGQFGARGVRKRGEKRHD